MNDLWVYDEETFPMIFCAGFHNMRTGERFTFEYSWRKNEIYQLIQFIGLRVVARDYLVGFNNLGFDYPVLHFILENQGKVTVLEIYEKAMSIINTPWNFRFNNVIWDRDQLIQQIDLFKIHHFDNPSRATSLKMLEFNMRRKRVLELPFDPGSVLNWQQCDILISYMWDDIDATVDFCDRSMSQIQFRKDLTEKYGRNFLNSSDPKIGADYIIMKLQEHSPSFDKKARTERDQIRVEDILFPYISFTEPEFQRIHNYFRNLVITETKGALADINCTVKGFQFDFGTGGIHGSVPPRIVESDDQWIIEDWDVASYYPNLGIRNKLYPEHLGEIFCCIYEEVYMERKKYPKGSPENAMLKLALNATYGKSNDRFSCFYDPQYTMSITINGQLLLCMLAEKLMQLDRLEMIQINTDGLTVRYPRSYQNWVHTVADWWMKVTKLELESVEYRRMFIRDVNSYIGEYPDGKLKRKGAYGSVVGTNKGMGELDWSQNHSALIVPKAAEAALVHGKDVREFIENHQDMMDFMLRTKVPGGSRLVGVDYHGVDHPLQNITRYYISVMGLDLIKVMPPLKGKTEDRRIGIDTGWKVTPCNDMDHFIDADIEFEYYVREAEKLINPLRR